jgi:hypothetical protein
MRAWALTHQLAPEPAAAAQLMAVVLMALMAVMQLGCCWVQKRED